MKNLNDLGVQEMDAKEMEKTDGGVVWLGSYAIIKDVAMWAVGEWHDIKRGCEDALNEWDAVQNL